MTILYCMQTSVYLKHTINDNAVFADINWDFTEQTWTCYHLVFVGNSIEFMVPKEHANIWHIFPVMTMIFQLLEI